jgi:hypothetical protein
VNLFTEYGRAAVDLFRRIVSTGRAEGPPAAEEGPIAPGLFDEDIDVIRAEALLRKSERLSGAAEPRRAAEPSMSKSEKRGRKRERNLLKEYKRLSREVEELEKKRR